MSDWSPKYFLTSTPAMSLGTTSHSTGRIIFPGRISEPPPGVPSRPSPRATVVGGGIGDKKAYSQVRPSALAGEQTRSLVGTSARRSPPAMSCVGVDAPEALLDSQLRS